jgi:hypothetical protein
VAGDDDGVSLIAEQSVHCIAVAVAVAGAADIAAVDTVAVAAVDLTCDIHSRRDGVEQAPAAASTRNEAAPAEIPGADSDSDAVDVDDAAVDGP